MRGGHRRRRLLAHFTNFMNRFADRLAAEGLELRRAGPEILQVNVGKLCNLTCMHCHVNAGPKRKEIMTRATINRIIDWLAKTEIPTVDLTGSQRTASEKHAISILLTRHAKSWSFCLAINTSEAGPRDRRSLLSQISRWRPKTNSGF
jgi:MoaA/NifB/PqqE/SkfB family radical SAM enzyme